MGAVLVTGVAGFIGYHAARRLLAAGVFVLGVDKMDAAYYDPAWKRARLQRLEALPGFRFEHFDLADRAATDQLAETVPHLDAVLHLAAQACVPHSFERPDRYLRDNVLAFHHVLRVCRSISVERLVYASSSSVYGRVPLGTRLTEDLATERPVSPYGASKVVNEAMAERAWLEGGLKVTGLRLFKVYGPWGRPDTVFFRFVERMVRDQPIELRNHGDIRHSFTYIDDITDGILAALDHEPAPGAPHPRFNLGNPRQDALEDCVDHLERTLGRPARRLRVGLPVGDRAYSQADIARASSALGFAPRVDVETGLGRLADWYLATAPGIPGAVN